MPARREKVDGNEQSVHDEESRQVDEEAHPGVHGFLRSAKVVLIVHVVYRWRISRYSIIDRTIGPP